jgi:hypothetical protein
MENMEINTQRRDNYDNYSVFFSIGFVAFIIPISILYRFQVALSKFSSYSFCFFIILINKIMLENKEEKQQQQ